MDTHGRWNGWIWGATLLAALVVRSGSSAQRDEQGGGLPGVTTDFLRLPSGIALNYAVRGPARGKPIVLLHGLGDSWRSYELLMQHLPERYRVYVVSLRGHGLSDRPERGYTPDDMAHDVSALLDMLDLRDVTLAGHSYGSFVAQAVAQRDGGRVGRLVLIGSGPAGLRDEMRTEVEAAFATLSDPVDPEFIREFQRSTVYRPLPPAFFELLCSELARVPAAVLKEMSRSMDGTANVARLRNIRVPTLVIWGDRDALFSRAEQEALTATIPDARLLVYRDTGHAPHWEEPERVAQDLVAFTEKAS
ncbi:MAG TPA: alpha/beta hydrolase [Vicinamibacterales bacterium]